MVFIRSPSLCLDFYMRFIIKIFVTRFKRLFENILSVVANVVPVQVVRFHYHLQHRVVNCNEAARKNTRQKRRKQKAHRQPMPTNNKLFKLEEIMDSKPPMGISLVEKIVHHRNIIRAYRTANQCLVLLFHSRRTHLISE